MQKLDWNAYDQRHNKSGVPPEKSIARLQMQGTSLMNFAVDRLADSWLTRKDFTYHILRASMVIIFLFFGYQKWFEYEAKVLIPYISNGPLIFWLYPVFGIRGASWFLGASEWLFGTASVSWLLEQVSLHPGRTRINSHVCRHGHHYPLYAEWVGAVGRRVPCDGWQCSFSYEGRRVARGLHLFAEGRCGEGTRPT